MFSTYSHGSLRLADDIRINISASIYR